jgi:hypothetical protein
VTMALCQISFWDSTFTGQKTQNDPRPAPNGAHRNWTYSVPWTLPSCHAASMRVLEGCRHFDRVHEAR